MISIIPRRGPGSLRERLAWWLVDLARLVYPRNEQVEAWWLERIAEPWVVSRLHGSESAPAIWWDMLKGEPDGQ